MKKSLKPFVLLCCVAFSLIYACTKDDHSSSSGDLETQTSVDNSFAESTSDDVTTISTQSVDNGVSASYHDSGYSRLLSPCATVSFDTSTHTITIDFGTNYCKCYDGKYRKGKIIITYSGRYRDSGSMHSVSFDNYYVNNYKVEGSQTVTNNGHNSNGNLTFTVKVNHVITDSANNKLTYTSTRTREWVQGEATKGWLGWLDDVYSITGDASGTNFNGNSFTAKITKPLIVALNCRWIESGTIDYTPEGKLTRTIDFGNGNCNPNKTVTIAGKKFTILLWW